MAFGFELKICHSIFLPVAVYQLHAATSSWSNRIGFHRLPKQPKGESYMICTISLGSSSNCPLRMHTGRCGISLAAPPAHSSLAEGRKPQIDTHDMPSSATIWNYNQKWNAFISTMFSPKIENLHPNQTKKNRPHTPWNLQSRAIQQLLQIEIGSIGNCRCLRVKRRDPISTPISNISPKKHRRLGDGCLATSFTGYQSVQFHWLPVSQAASCLATSFTGHQSLAASFAGCQLPGYQFHWLPVTGCQLPG